MQYSDNAIKIIQAFQPCHLVTYTNMSKETCIGFEHKLTTMDLFRNNNTELDVEELEKSVDKATELLRIDLDNISIYITNLINAGFFSFMLTQYEFDALVSFAFCRGLSDLTKFVSGRNRHMISSDILRFVKNGRFSELVETQWRLAESILFSTGRLEGLPNYINLIFEGGKMAKAYLNPEGDEDSDTDINILEGDYSYKQNTEEDINE